MAVCLESAPSNLSLLMNTAVKQLAFRRIVRRLPAPSARLPLHLGEEFGRGSAQCQGELPGHQDGGHALAALQQADIVAVQVGLGGEGLLGEAQAASGYLASAIACSCTTLRVCSLRT